jgi:hypothetical protein
MTSQGRTPLTGPTPVNLQIASSSDYYEPAVYAFGSKLGNGLSSLLSFYSSLTVTADAATSQFIPVSAVPSRGRNSKLFAIGILPPSMSINDGELLDRSASITNRTGGITVPASAERGEDEAAINAAKVEEVPYNIDSISIEAGQSQAIDNRVFRRNQGALNSLHGSIRPLALALLAAASREGILLVITEGVRSAARQEQLYAQGRGADAGKGKIVTGARGGESWHQYGLAFDVAIAGQNGSPTWPPNDDLWNKVGSLGEGLGLTWGGRFTTVVDKPHFEFHPGFGIAEAKAGRLPPIPPPEPAPIKADTDSATFVGFGSESANAYKRDVARQTDLLGVEYYSSQRSYRKALKASLEAMQNTPPLRLLVNPNSFSVKSQKIVSDGNWGRKGPIIEFWGDDQDKISGSGQVAAFYALDAAPQLGRGGPGLTRHARNMSLAWQNFQSLYLLYRNNGAMYLPDVNQMDRDVLLTAVGSVYLYYDGILYIGSFDSLNVRESDQKPFTVEYDFEFTVRAAFLLDRPPDFAYGGGTAFAGGRVGLPTRSENAPTQSIADVAAFGSSVVNSSDVQGTLNAASEFLLDSAGTRF